MPRLEINEVPVEERLKASYSLAETVDKVVRRLSRYGDLDAIGFDERMAVAGLTHTLATWWSILDEDQFKERLDALVKDITAQRTGIIAQNAMEAEPAPRTRGGRTH